MELQIEDCYCEENGTVVWVVDDSENKIKHSVRLIHVQGTNEYAYDITSTMKNGLRPVLTTDAIHEIVEWVKQRQIANRDILMCFV